jgi:drug/metabolite transporter (DMT)-like permease
MYSEEDLDAAVAAGAISSEAATALREHTSGLRRTAAVDEEHFRLVSGFNDIFVAIASLLLLASVAWIGAAAAPWIGAISTCGTAWALAEYFVRKRHMALPAIILLVAFVGGSFLACLLFLDGGSAGTSMAIASTVTALAAWSHWKRFHVPITVAAGVAAVVGGLIVTLISEFPASENWLSLMLFLAGVATFGCALAWDASDAKRLTRRSDVAFWLHLLAAPLLVHPVFTTLGMLSGNTNVLQTITFTALYVGIALISLAIDRRALMVSALGYVLYAFTALLKQAGFVSLSFALTALAIGSALLVLSAFWHKSRRFAVQMLPATIQARLASLP